MSAPPLILTRLRPLHWALYGGFWLVMGLLLSLAELQHYLQRGGLHPWEPFLWELSSAAAAGLLALGVLWLHQRLFERERPVATRLAGHALGLLLYGLAHPALMYGLRALVYRSTGVAYEPGGVLEVLAYEGAKDSMSYLLIVAICHGVLIARRERQRHEDWQRLNSELAVTRLARLQEQIQPHFLFNTLNLVSSVMYEDVERADRLLAELCDLLRLSLDAGRTPTHSLRAELRLVQPFLSLMTQRFEGRLSSRVVVSDEAAACELPSLLLMAPLENAVKHGVAHGSAPVSVVLEAGVHDGRLEIRVRDSAHPGGAADAPASPREGGGLGLANTRERLATLYGDAAGLSLVREPGQTVLHLWLPARPAVTP